MTFISVLWFKIHFQNNQTYVKAQSCQVDILEFDSVKEADQGAIILDLMSFPKFGLS